MLFKHPSSIVINTIESGLIGLSFFRVNIEFAFIKIYRILSLGLLELLLKILFPSLYQNLICIDDNLVTHGKHYRH